MQARDRGATWNVEVREAEEETHPTVRSLLQWLQSTRERVGSDW